MSSWNFDPVDLKIKNVTYDGWEIALKDLKNERDLLFWLLQAAKHNFNMAELFDALLEAGRFCFGSDAVNGAVMLQDLYNLYPSGTNGPVDWVEGTHKPKLV